MTATLDVDLIADFKYYLESRGRSEHTIRAYTSDVRMFAKWCDHNNELPDATNIERLAARWINEMRNEASPASVVRRIASLRLFAKVTLDASVLHDYSAPKPATGYAHPLPNGVDDLRAMLKAARFRHQPLIALCGFAGARISEARQVTGDDVTMDDDGQYWVLLHGKGSKDRLVPLVDEAVPWLHLTTFGLLAPFGDRAARGAITSTGRRAGISRDVSSHDLRMTFGTEVYARTKDLRTTQELMGHENSHTTERYTGVSREAAVSAVREAFS